MRKFAFLFCSFMLVSSCAHVPFKAEKRTVEQQFTNPHPFNYPREEFPVELKIIGKKKEYVIKKVTFASALPHPGEKNVVTGYYYEITREEKSPAVIVLPMAGGGYYFSRKIAALLASEGFNCLWLERGERLLGSRIELDSARRRFIKTIIDIRRSIDWLRIQGKVDPERIGITGISMGSFLAAIVTGVDGRIKSSVFILGGGNLPELLLTSREKSIRSFRKRIIKREKISPEEFRELIRTKLKDIDPLTYAHRLSPGSVLMINTVNDVVVPRECTVEFWKACGEPDLIWLPFTHTSSYFAFRYARGKMLEHFQRTLARKE